MYDIIVAVIRIVGVSVVILGITSCTGSNIKSEWDCPKPEGGGCIDIRTADDEAVASILKRKRQMIRRGEDD